MCVPINSYVRDLELMSFRRTNAKWRTHMKIHQYMLENLSVYRKKISTQFSDQFTTTKWITIKEKIPMNDMQNDDRMIM